MTGPLPKATPVSHPPAVASASPPGAGRAGPDVLASPSLYRSTGKRALDLALVLITAPIWLTLIAIAALLVALDGHTPFYRQERLGRDGRVFRIFKLRSMVYNADSILESYLDAHPEARAEWAKTQKLKQDPRITWVGCFIRKTSLDELPQIFNVIKGEMSLVGPRPITVNQKALYPGKLYYEMRPGLSGFWQISDRNDCRFVDRVRYDNAYFSSVSLKTDLVVILRTLGVVLRGTGY
jgi:lipopolysaccharide/colanic/teichoic acid biosynthesis glycosyltransferase